MKNRIQCLTVGLCLVLQSGVPGRADDLQALAGKWETDRKDGAGRTIKQVLQVTGGKFKFKVLRDGSLALQAEGDVKTEALGPFKSAHFFNIQAAEAGAALESVDEERTVVYLLDGDDLSVAANFDRAREEPPVVDKYARVAEGAKSLVIDKIVMHKTPQSAEWYLCFEATAAGVTKRFNVPDKAYSKEELTLQTDLEIPGVHPDAKCSFVMKLDDVAGDECTDQMDDKSEGSFSASASGSQDFKPEGSWSYTIYWHLK